VGEWNTSFYLLKFRRLPYSAGPHDQELAQSTANGETACNIPHTANCTWLSITGRGWPSLSSTTNVGISWSWAAQNERNPDHLSKTFKRNPSLGGEFRNTGYKVVQLSSVDFLQNNLIVRHKVGQTFSPLSDHSKKIGWRLGCGVATRPTTPACIAW